MSLPEMSLNAPEELILENVKASIKRPLPQLQTYHKQDQALAIVGGGPSLIDSLDILKERAAEGVKVVSVNGSHNWLIEMGIIPAIHIQLDAREFNKKFVSNPQKKTKYFLASQCHPAVFDALDGYETYIFHCLSTKGEESILDKHYLGKYFKVMGGTTVVSRAFCLLMMLGFSRFELFGYDSCYMDGKHHAYDQPENNEKEALKITVAGREFLVAPWMLSQAQDFIDMGKSIGQHYDLIVHGDGLINHIIMSGADKIEEK